MRKYQAETVAAAVLAVAVLMVEVLVAQEHQVKETQVGRGIIQRQCHIAAVAAAARAEQAELQLLL